MKNTKNAAQLWEGERPREPLLTRITINKRTRHGKLNRFESKFNRCGSRGRSPSHSCVALISKAALVGN